MVKIISKRRFGSIGQFHFLLDKKLGCGSFGTVALARHKNTCRMYAIKMINIKELPSQTEVKLVEREIRLHNQIDHPHIIKLWDTLFDGDIIYMIMEYAQLGNLFYYQNSKGAFNQAQAFKYFTQTLQAIHYLHSNNIIHRDIKPQNLLLDCFHNIKLCDFGWCAQQKSLKRNTFCGTYEYMAPQMLFKGQYDFRVDIWALGVLLFQMLHGHAPFKGKTAGQVKESMLRGNFELGDHVSDEAKKLIENLLQFNPDKRFTTEDILKHSWIKNMQAYINNNLKLQNSSTPKETHEKIIVLNSYPTIKKSKQDNSYHRKNNTMNFLQHKTQQQATPLHFIKLNKPKRHFHSQQKQSDQLYSKDLQNYASPTNNKHLLDFTNKTYSSDLNLKTIQKTKCVKMGKCRQKQKKNENTCQSLNNKKFKLRNSEVQQLSQKYPIRFNTQMYDKDDYEPVKLKKSNIKSKFLANSKSSILKLNKNTKNEDRIY